MTSTTEAQLIKMSIELLSQLTTPLNKNHESGEVKEFDEALRRNVSVIINSDKFRILEGSRDKLQWRISNLQIHDRWHFVKTCLYLMEIIRDTMKESKDEKMKLLSVSEKKTLEATLQFVISLGLLQYLLPGVGVPLEMKSKNVGNITAEDLSDFAKYKRLCSVVDALLNLDEVDVFHDLIVSKHLEDVLAALFQLAFAPLKKPVSGTSDSSIENLQLLDDNEEIKTMSYAVWRKLEENKQKYESVLADLQKKLYRPLIIRKYLILLGSNKTPRWMRLNLTNVLTNLVLEENGVVATIQGVVDVNSESPLQWSHCATVAKLISNVFCSENEMRVNLLVPQLLKILSNDRRQMYEYVFIQVTASAVVQMLHSHPRLVEQHLLGKILKPLKTVALSTEDDIGVSINQLYNLCVVPSNESIRVPIRVILPVSSILFFVHRQVKDSVWYLKSVVEELLAKLLLEDDSALPMLFDTSVLGERQPPIVPCPDNKKFVLTENGGLSLMDAESTILDDAGGIFLELIKSIKENEKLVSSFFVHLLRKYVDENGREEGVGKRFVIVFLLTAMSEDPALNHVLKNAESVIQFIGDLLQLHSDEDTDEHENVISICLTFLTLVLYDLQKKKDVKWDVFACLLPSLRKLKKSSLSSVSLLAEQVCNLILTRNVIGKCKPGNASAVPSIEEVKSEFEKAFDDACDALLPNRAHGLMQLNNLIQKGDAETIAKKETVLCLFQENLKDKDSYLYLRAIEGLARLAALKPRDVLPSLCQEFSSCSIPEKRLKVGESLIRAVKLLNDFLFEHKRLLVNTFLNGVKDSDSLVRASSLSNLGEVCLTLKDNIDDMLYEVVYCAQNVACSDEDVEPRRAAILLISSLFRGLRSSVFEVLESHLLGIYRMLRQIYSNDSDDTVRLQAELALEILNENTKELFTATAPLEKKIHVLRPLDQ